MESNHITLPTLVHIWSEKDPAALICCQCNEKLGSEPLARTFRQHEAGDAVSRDSSQVASRIYEDVLGLRIELFDRHVRCLSGVSYVAVSHVWDPAISELQNAGPDSPTADLQIRETLFKSVASIVQGLNGHATEGTQIWHDYLSVPQWSYDIKTKILTAIPHIYQGAQFTLIYMQDVTIEMVRKVEHGNSSQERIDGITGICNERWYKRVWTSMEYVRSRQLKVMIQGHQVQEDRPDIFRVMLDSTWNRELAIHGWNNHRVEAMAGMGKNQVPWNLGLSYLQLARSLTRVDFGMGYAVLSRRGCQSTRDFSHALLGFLKIELQEPLEKDDLAALRQIAMACMREGDYSPLLMASNMEIHDPQGYARRMMTFGYNDALVFGLGPRQANPDFHSESTFRSAVSTIQLEHIGLVNSIGAPPRRSAGPDGMIEFAWTAGIVLSFTGPNVDDFVNTIAGRLYDFSTDKIAAALRNSSQRRVMQKLLNECHMTHLFLKPLNENVARRLSDAFELHFRQR